MVDDIFLREMEYEDGDDAMEQLAEAIAQAADYEIPRSRGALKGDTSGT